MRRPLHVAGLVGLLAATVLAEPVLEWAPTPAGPWEVDTEAAIIELPGGNFQVWTPTEADSVPYRQRVYRLVDGEAEVAHCPIGLRRSITMEFMPGDRDSDGDGVPDCRDLCPGHDDRIDEDGNGIPDDCDIPGMVRIAGGTFEMGDSFHEAYPDRRDERPVHTVFVSTFYLEKREVTKAVWDEVYAWALGHGYSFRAEQPDEPFAIAKGWNHPVYRLNWYDVVKWCNARSEKEELTPCYWLPASVPEVYRTGHTDIRNEWVRWDANGYRLPTEAEWEKAARGGLTGKRFPWGDTISHGQANYYSAWKDGRPQFHYDVSPTEGYHPLYDVDPMPYTAPPGSFDWNGYGLYDMAGNQDEWCWDWHEEIWYGRPEASAMDPRGPASGGFRLRRGGSWASAAFHLRCAIRDAAQPPNRGPGLRCARSRL